LFFRISAPSGQRVPASPTHHEPTRAARIRVIIHLKKPMKKNPAVFGRHLLLAIVLASLPNSGWAADVIEATTTDGRSVILHPDGHWEFGAGTAPAAAAPNAATASKTAAPSSAAPAAAGSAAAGTNRPDDRYCQGGLFGVGRRICPGDPDYNRGSLNPKLR
jgi:hypothetical protein